MLLVYVGRENACKTHGKADICAEGTSVACAECQCLKRALQLRAGKEGSREEGDGDGGERGDNKM